MKPVKASLMILMSVALAACATQAPGTVTPDGAGFFHGFWDGFIALFALIGSIFMDISIYSTPNSGFGYNLGFVCGFSIWIASGGIKIHYS